MAGHGGGGGGGGKKKGGPLSAIRGNGCLTYIALWVVGLLLLVSGVCAAGSGILSGLNLPIPGITSPSSGISISSRPVSGAAAPAAAAPARAPAASQPVSQPAASTGGGNTTTAPSGVINSVPLQGAQGALITPYLAPAFYIVRPGDTLDTIAAMYGTTASSLRTYNRLTSDQLQIGQVLYLPPATFNTVPNTGRNAGKDSDAPNDPTDANGNQ
ncbi:MAG TPA: LysM peptidoglycan-binding domain-containing protein [Chloroflexia bacterium]|jgi:LysM repeat protein|nr:LysM peptidoglycan-binding domain-containing protein [Chloroflexia bacterium]